MKKKNINPSQQVVSMPIVNPHAAGIDIGSKSHFVCVSQDKVSEFGVCTEDLHQIAQYLQSHKVKTVALASTGFYWRPLFVIFKIMGFEVVLVNARHVKKCKGT
ncbi:MAG: transposase [Bacteroidota bacterium]